MRFLLDCSRISIKNFQDYNDKCLIKIDLRPILSKVNLVRIISARKNKRINLKILYYFYDNTVRTSFLRTSINKSKLSLKNLSFGSIFSISSSIKINFIK